MSALSAYIDGTNVYGRDQTSMDGLRSGAGGRAGYT